MQNKDIDYKIEKYNYKLKHASNTQDAKIYRKKIKQYQKHRKHQKQHGGSDDFGVDKIISASRHTLDEKINLLNQNMVNVYDQKKIDTFNANMKDKINDVIDKYNNLVKEKDEMCEKLKNKNCTKEIDLNTEKLLNDKKFIESICGVKQKQLPPITADVTNINIKLDEIRKKTIDYSNKVTNKSQLSDQDKKDLVNLIQTLREFIANPKNNLNKANEKAKLVSEDLKKLFDVHIVRQFFLSDEFKFSLSGEPEIYECQNNCTIKVPTLFLLSGADIQNKITDSFKLA